MKSMPDRYRLDMGRSHIPCPVCLCGSAIEGRVPPGERTGGLLVGIAGFILIIVPFEY